MELRFRYLKADEIECRISTVKSNGIQLLLYKDARVDQKLLDEVVGVMNWKREHQLIGDSLYCTVSVYDEEKQMWVSKQDVGTESYTEKKKGEASDSFKRACFNWGIGRELYTAPFIWIPKGKCNITSDQKGNNKCYDKFQASKIEITEGNITGVEIVNKTTRNVVFKYGFKEDVEYIDDIKVKTIRSLINEYLNGEEWKILNHYNVDSVEHMTFDVWNKAMKTIENVKAKKGGEN